MGSTTFENAVTSVKTLVVYHTRFGNTKQVAEAIGEGYRGAGEARVISMESLAGRDLQDVDLMVMRTPTHKTNLPVEARRASDELPKRILRGQGWPPLTRPISYLRFFPGLRLPGA
jgi:flavorubredoxin